MGPKRTGSQWGEPFFDENGAKCVHLYDTEKPFAPIDDKSKVIDTFILSRPEKNTEHE